MHFKKTIQAGLSALALAGLAACQSNTQDNTPQVVATGEAYGNPSDVHFVYDPEGNISRQLPVEMLQDIQGQLQAQGLTDLAKEMETLYDFKTGEVKDARAAEKAESFLKARLPQAQPTAQPAAQPDALPNAEETKLLRPEDLPTGITISPEMIERFRQANAKGGAL
jgi:hypothetical protein